MMENLVKPLCYDSKPACLCNDCQLYDVKMIDVSKSADVLSRFAASVSSRPTFEFSCAVTSALSSRPLCSVAESTSGLAAIDCVPRRPPVPKPVRKSPVPRRPPSFSVSMNASPAVSVTSSAQSVGSVALPVSSSCPAVSRPVSVPSSPPVVSRPVAASPSSVIGPPVRPPFGPYVRPVAPPRMPLFWPYSPFSAVVRFVLVLPVLLPTPFGLVFAFLPVLR